MSLMHIRGFHLQHTTVPELLEKVVKSHAAYDGKDCIKFARKTSGQHAADSRLKRLGIQTVSLGRRHMFRLPMKPKHNLPIA